MHESRPLRGVSVANGQMTIEGVNGRFFQGAGRPVRLEARGLRFVAGFAAAEGGLRDMSRIEASAMVSDGTLRRAGHDDVADAIALTIRALPGSGEARMLLTLGMAAEEAGFAGELWLPDTVFAALKADCAAGTAQILTLAATTSLWVRETERETRRGLPTQWYLGLEADGHTSSQARGFVETIDWSASPAVDAMPAAIQAGQEEELEPDETAEQLGRLNWSLKQLLVVLAFMLIVIGMK